MANVIVLDSVNDDIFVCGLCKSVFNSLQMFLDHKKSQCRTINNDIIATTPPYIEKQSNEAATSHELGTNLCTVCKETCKSVNGFHPQKSHSYEKTVFQCPVCGRCFDYNSHLKRHLATHKVWPDGLTETTAKSPLVQLSSYSCTYCNTVLSNYSLFRAHLSIHISLKKYKCIQGDCNEFFDKIEELLCHVSVVHCKPKYICHKCRKIFQSLADIANHVCQDYGVKTNQIQQLKCSLCDAIFRKPESLSLHMLTESHNKSCIHCNKTFASDKRLRMHLQIHNTYKPYHCNICNSNFQSKKYLKSHLLKHGERQHTCMVCKRTFKRQDVLNRHTKTHQLRKLFKCPFKDFTGCTKEFSRKDKLDQHIKSHTKYMKNMKQKSPNDTGIVEICIVPLDNEIDNSD